MFDHFGTCLAQSDLDMLGVPDWTMMGYWCIALGAVGYVALQYGVLRSRAMAVVGIVLLLAAAILGTWHQIADLQTLTMLAFFALAGVGCVTFTTVREPIYAALGFATAVLSGCGVLFMLGAYFVSAATMIVYAGATIIIFLFVLMFSQREYLQTYDLRLNQPIAAAAACAILFGLIYYAVCNSSVSTVAQRPASTRPYSQVDPLAVGGNTVALGRALYTDYLFAVEVAGTLLLVATIGAIGVAARSAQTDTP